MAAGQQTGVGSGSGGGRPLLSCVRAARLPPFQCPLLLLLQEHYDYKDDKEEGGKERGKREGGKERKKFFSDHFPLHLRPSTLFGVFGGAPSLQPLDLCLSG